MIRNHAEAVVEPAGVEDLTNMFGHNFRLTEMSAAVGLAQLESIIFISKTCKHCNSDDSC